MIHCYKTDNRNHIPDGLLIGRSTVNRSKPPKVVGFAAEPVPGPAAPDPRNAGKKIKGRKRHVMTGTNGFMVGLIVHGAAIQDRAVIQDRDGAVPTLQPTRRFHPFLPHVLADGGDAGDTLKQALKGKAGWTIEVIRRCDDQKGFKVLPHRWVVERTLAWLGRGRRLAKDREKSIESSTAWILIAHIRILMRRLARYCHI